MTEKNSNLELDQIKSDTGIISSSIIVLNQSPGFGLYNLLEKFLHIQGYYLSESSGDNSNLTQQVGGGSWEDLPDLS